MWWTPHVTYASGARVNYAYDATGRLNSINVNPTNANGVGTDLSRTNLLLSSLQYNGANDLLGWTWADSVLYRRTYDTFGRIKTYPLGNPAGTGNAAGSTRTIGYDDGGRITGFTHANGAGTAQPTLDQSFGYDGLDRLVSAIVSAVQYGYAYDATGNRTSRTVAGTSYANGIAATNNRLTSVQTPGTSGTVTNTYAHDAAGNLTSDGASSFTYGARGRASSVTVAAGTLGYLYNGLELRTVKTGPVAVVPGGAAYYVYDEAGQQLGEYDSAGVPVHETIYLDGLPVGVIRQTRTGSGATLNVQSVADFVYSDHLATPRVIARASDHAIAWRWDGAEAFGATAPDENPSGLGAYKFNQRFPGQSFDAETGAFYNWHRSYSPALGRYTQSDPIGLVGGVNTYGYVGADPISSLDPDGLQAQSIRATQPTLQLTYTAPISSAQGALLVNQIRSFDPSFSYSVVRPSFSSGNNYSRADVNLLSSILRSQQTNQTCSRQGVQVGRFIGDQNGNMMIEPAGGSTVPYGRGGQDTHTLYPNGSNYMRLNPAGHGSANPTPHGHGHLPGAGVGRGGQGSSLDVLGNVVSPSSPAAHWPIY